MAIDFPNSPTLNQIYTVGSRSWIWDGSTWNIYANVPNRYIQDAPPSSPQSGDQWFESDTGRLFVYYDSAWVEIGNATDIAGALQPGQVTALSAVTSLTTDDVFPVIDNPSSATAANKITYGNLVTAMTSSIAPGLVLVKTGTLSSTSTNFADAFTSTYTNYRITIDRPQLSGAGDIYWRLLTGTTAATSNDYGWGFIGRTFGGSTVTSESNGNTLVYTGFTQSGVNNTPIGAITIDLYSPKVTSRTFGLTQSCGYNGTYFFSYQGLGLMNLTTQYDGIQFLTSSAVTMGGNVKIYGYRD